MAPVQHTTVFAAVMIMVIARVAMADLPSPNGSTARTAAPPGVTPVLYNLPSGKGSTFTQAQSTVGIVDATITLNVVDDNDMPVANFSRSDMWLEAEVVAGAGNFIACSGGATADADTDTEGVTTWVAPLRSGGWSTSKTLVVINGAPLTTNAGLVLRHNSADLNGNGVANLADVTQFAGDYFRAYAFRSDLWFDGVLNLSDISRLAEGVGAVCP